MSIFLFSYVLVAKIEEQKTCEYIAVFLTFRKFLMVISGFQAASVLKYTVVDVL